MRPTGRLPGFKPVHALVAVVLAVVWFAGLGYVLTHGRDQASSVNVYSELPPDLDAGLQQQGVRFSGLSPVDGSVVQQVLSHATTEGSIGSGGSSPIVLRTSFSDHTQKASYRDQPALMVVVPNARPTGGGSGSSVFVAFLDPTTYRVLTTVSYDSTG